MSTADDDNDGHHDNGDNGIKALKGQMVNAVA